MTMTRPTTDQITHKGQLLSDVLDRQFNLLDFGAVGDGVTDDMDALIAAIDAIRNAGGGTLFIPATANGYYLRYGTGSNVASIPAISIVSDGAVIKLQGGTIPQAGTSAVFRSGSNAPITNFRMSGLRFEAASTVLRLGNAGEVTHFDDEVATGNADPLEQTSFRYVFASGGAARNIAISDCYFGPGIHYPISIKNSVDAQRITGVSLLRLRFEGITQQCIYLGDTDDAMVSDITIYNKRGCRFDWAFYVETTNNRPVISRVRAVNEVRPPDAFGARCMQINAPDGRYSNVYAENFGYAPLVFVYANRVSLVDVCIVNSLAGLEFFGDPANPLSDIQISNLKIIDCDYGLWWSGTGYDYFNVRIDNFIVSGCAERGVLMQTVSSVMRDIVFSNGTFVDSGTNNVCVRTNTGSTLRDVMFENVTFAFRSAAPPFSVIDIRGANDVVRLVNCRFVSTFATGTGIPVAVNGGTVMMTGCHSTGWSVPLTSSSNQVRQLVTESASLETTLTANSTTPSVSNGLKFVTANSSATAITNFTNGVEGQEITVRVNDANTTFDFSASNLKGNNGVDYTATSGDLVFAKKLGSNWYCTICEA